VAVDAGPPDPSADDDDRASDDDAASDQIPYELPQDALSSDSQGAIVIRVSNSTSTVLANGVYAAPYSANSSTQSSIDFLPGGLALLMPSLQVQMSIPREQQDDTMSCMDATDLLIRYGAPPTGASQLLADSCDVQYSYDDSDGSYTGTFEGHFGDGLTEPDPALGADIEGMFTFIYTE
jgi:hypothetical protein